MLALATAITLASCLAPAPPTEAVWVEYEWAELLPLDGQDFDLFIGGVQYVVGESDPKCAVALLRDGDKVIDIRCSNKPQCTAVKAKCVRMEQPQKVTVKVWCDCDE